MSKRIQMRKQRFVAIQKIMSEKKMPAECAPPAPWDAHSLSKGGSLGRGAPPPPRHSLSSTGAPPPPPRHHHPSMDRCGRHLQEVRYKVRDPKAHSKGGTLESSIEDPPAPPLHALQPTKVNYLGSSFT